MDRRKPADDKKRAVAEILGRGDETTTREPDPRRGVKTMVRSSARGREHVGAPGSIAEEEPQAIGDEYQPIGYGTEFEPDPEGRRGGALVAIVVIMVAIALVAASLILARDQVAEVLSSWLFGSRPSGARNVGAASSSAVAGQALAGAAEAGGDRSQQLQVENDSLREQLLTEKARAEKLESQLGGLQKQVRQSGAPDAANAGELSDLRDRVATLERELAESKKAAGDARAGEAEIRKELKKQSDAAQDRLAGLDEANRKLRDDNEQLTGRVTALSRELEAGQSEIEVLRSSLDRNQDISEQVAQVNNEYRRALGLLKETKDDIATKDKRVAELQAENEDLRKTVTGLQRGLRETQSKLQAIEEARQVFTAPVPTRQVRPEYPQTARSMKISGTVRLKVLVSKEGKVLEAEVLSSPDPTKALDMAAIRAVRQWMFEPATRGGNPMDYWYSVPMEFVLDRENE